MSIDKKYEYFLLEVKDGIAVMSVNRPEVRNAINEDVWAELEDFVDYANSNSEIRVLIITGTGEKAFVSGADIGKFAAPRTAADALKVKHQMMCVNKMENAMFPIIAAVNGYAFGGGCELALACDLRIASENAQFGLPEVGLGIVPGWGGTQRLSRIVGIGRAKEMIMTGRPLKGPEAAQWGLVTKCVPLENLMKEAMALANVLKNKAPLALAMAKKLIKHSFVTDLEAGTFMESMGLNMLMESEDKAEGTAAFKEKRKPNFKGK